jgi:pilus assembly protein CpaF
MLVQVGAPQWSLKAIRHLILYGVDLIVTVEKINGERKLKNISRIASLEDSGFCLEPLYEL